MSGTPMLPIDWTAEEAEYAAEASRRAAADSLDKAAHLARVGDRDGMTPEAYIAEARTYLRAAERASALAAALRERNAAR